VRDSYLLGDRRLLITTDRVSAFDSVLGTIPFKGQVLNQLTNWWFQNSLDIVPNHLLSRPHPNAVIVKNAQPLPLEVVVRSYLTGSSKTALWTLYQEGRESIYGVKLPPNLQKNTPLPQPVITPTTKDESDTPLSHQNVVERGLLSQERWDEVVHTALKLFERGQELARRAGLILVDTKYEFGLVEGALTLIDEIHTPDSSRYWVAGTEHLGEPVHQDKEVLRLWLVSQGYKGHGAPPEIPRELGLDLARLYLKTYQMLTGETLEPPNQTVEEALEGVELSC
jgi:phosphoribosylaminoimidazole-succinocarboxamide synthase